MSCVNHRSGPGISAVRPTTSVRARAEQVASEVLEEVLRSHHEANDRGASNLRLATRVGLCERMIRDYRDGSRAVPLWFVLALPPELADEVIRAVRAELRLLSSGVGAESHHRQLVSRVGELSSVLDRALIDGQLDAAERSELALRMRQIAARAEQAARDLQETGT